MDHIIWILIYEPYYMDHIKTSRQLIENEHKSCLSMDILCPAFFR